MPSLPETMSSLRVQNQRCCCHQNGDAKSQEDAQQPTLPCHQHRDVSFPRQQWQLHGAGGWKVFAVQELKGKTSCVTKKPISLPHLVPNPFIHSMLQASQQYTQFPVTSLGSSKERGQPGVTTKESPATHTRESWIHLVLQLCPEHSAEWILASLLTQARGWLAPSTGELGWAKIRMQCVLSVRSNSRWLWPMALVQHWDEEVQTIFYLESRAQIPTLTPPLWKKQEQCTAEQLQLRALKNLKFSQVSVL